MLVVVDVVVLGEAVVDVVEVVVAEPCPTSVKHFLASCMAERGGGGRVGGGGGKGKFKEGK